MSVLKIDLEYRPRPFQDYLHKNVRRFNVIVLPRRSGKSVWCVHEMIDRGLTCQLKNPNYVYLTQSYGQGKRVIWDIFKNACLKIPGAETNEQELKITIPRPANRDKITYRILGAENPDSLRGLSLDGAMFDEAAFMSEDVFSKIIGPALADRNGWCSFLTTPNGQNWIWQMYNDAENKPDWFRYKANVYEIGALAPEEIEAAKQRMSEEEFNQEFMCSFTAAISGSYWGKQVEEAETTGRVTEVPYDKAMGVQVYVDLGVDDATAMWFVQAERSGRVRIIDYLEESGLGLDDYAKILQDKRYKYDVIGLPFDAKVRELGTGKTRFEIFQKLMPGVRIIVLPRYDVADSINAARMLISRCWFDKVKTADGIISLKNYQRRYNPKLKVFEQKPLHDNASHGADAFRYLSMALKDSSDGGSVDEGKNRQRYAVSDFLVV